MKRLALLLLVGCTPHPDTSLDDALVAVNTELGAATTALATCDAKLSLCVDLNDRLLDVAAAQAEAFEACRGTTETAGCGKAVHGVYLTLRALRSDGGAP